MKRFFLALAALAILVPQAQAQQPTREQMEAAIAQMPKIPNSDAVKIGRLDNGLTYYIRHNELPKGRAEFYLATNVGAIQEIQPQQDGLAHFLEHMCFNGTKNFPDKTILNYLRSIGAEFGSNINASTGFEETQYMLNNIPVERESVVDSCLMILGDYSHYVLNEPKEIDAERGVIIEERRTRRNASWRSMERSLPYYFGADSKLAQCTLIGTQEHLETFKYESLNDFYHTWYHPGNQAVIVVGDVDVDRTEAKIKEIFGSIPAKENPLPKPIQSIANHAEPRVGIITDPETTAPSIELIWHSEAMPESVKGTALGQVTDLLESVIRMVMRERFNDITSKPGSAYLSGSFGVSDLIYEDIEAVMGDVTLREDNILGGFKDFYTELVRLQRYGITDAEFQRVKADYLSMLETRANRASTRQNPEFIYPILSNFFDKEPILEPADEKELIETFFGQLNATAISQAVAQLWSGENMVIVYNGPEKEGISTPTAEQLLQVIEEVNASEIAAPEGEDIPEAFLDPAKLKGAKIAKTASTIYGATQWTLKNGVQVIVYPTDLQKDQILFNLYKDGGTSLISDEDLASFESNVLALFQSNSGVSAFSGTTVSKMLTGKNLSVNPYFNKLENGINGNSTVKDFETAMQLVYLYYMEPRFDPEEWQNGIDQIKAVLPNLVNQPNYKLQTELYKTLYGGNPRHQMISDEVLAKANLATVEKNWKALFADAAGAKLVIVGDVNPEAIKPVVEKYIGSLPKGKKALKWVDNNDDIVKGRIQKVIEVDMQTPKSTVLQVYTANVPYSYEKDAAMDAISYILDMHYTESLREEEGGTYGASTSATFSRRPKEQALIQIYFDCKPALCDKLRELAIKGIKDFAANGPTDEELNMVKLNLQKNIPESRQRNSWWRNNIELYLTYGQDRDAAYEAAVNGLTKESIQATLQEILAQDNFIELVMKPAATAEAE
ncbi:MAG: insulinase family protein [Bacteroidales bacterium]|nr:insulinase family protein [Bacteroidales bacterium]